ncbi:MAG: OmpP1/FadL family transporter [Desulfoplanes sp.]|nr:OmpP1/FadL family transporter [Desulfoplanes sp.]
MRTQMWKRIGLTTACIFLLAETAFGAGYGIYEWSARGNAMGGAMIGKADDPSAVAYNPAGITQLPGVQVMGGVTALMPRSTVDVSVTSSKDLLTGSSSRVGMSESTDTKDLGLDGLAPNAFLTWQANDKIWFGLGAFTRYGLASEYDSDWIGKYAEYYASVSTYSINPTIAYKINDQWSVAAGVEAMYVDIEIKKKIKLGNSDGDADLTGDCWAPGYNLAVHYTPTQWFAAGLTYRSEVHPHVEGDVDFTDMPSRYDDQNLMGYLDLPASCSLGLAFQVTDKLNVEVDAVYTMWSSYSEITFDYDDLEEVTEEKNWKDVWRFQLGVEYAYNDWLDLRFGYVFDQSPINDDYYDYMVPLYDRHIFNVGTGMHWGNFTLDLSYGYLFSADKDATIHVSTDTLEETQDVTFKDAHCHMVSMNVGYAF